MVAALLGLIVAMQLNLFCGSPPVYFVLNVLGAERAVEAQGLGARVTCAGSIGRRPRPVEGNQSVLTGCGYRCSKEGEQPGCPAGSWSGWIHSMTQPYAVPRQLPANLARVHDYWRSLLRGEATMPFSDDVKLAALPDLVDHLMLIDVFERPERFRFNSVGAVLNQADVAGEFLDEMKSPWPFEFLPSQCSATVERATPSYFRQSDDSQSPGPGAYDRLLLPLWGEGHINMLLGIVDFH